jgi:hypothetical protein
MIVPGVIPSWGDLSVRSAVLRIQGDHRFRAMSEDFQVPVLGSGTGQCKR